MTARTDTYTLNNGTTIPSVGFGTWQMEDDALAAAAVKTAIQAGYRHVDTAATYGNEKGVGHGIVESGIPREEIFLTTKLWNAERGYETTIAAFEASLNRLGTDYVDLYLIHWPANPKQFDNWQQLNAETWRAFEDLYDAGRIKAIGLSNFTPVFLEPLLETARIAPMVDQIEFHPGYWQPETLQYCQEHDILVEAWSPLGSGRMLENETLGAIAQQHGVSVAQVCIRWCLQHGTLPLPKSATPERIVANAEVFGFALSDDEMRQIDELPTSGYSGMHPERVDF